MQPFRLRVEIDANAAIMAGNDFCGLKDIPVTPSFLTVEQRQLFAALPSIPGEPHIRLLPNIGRSLAAVEPEDAPALLDEVLAYQNRQVSEREAKLQVQYDKWHSWFMNKPVMPALNEVVITKDAVTVKLPQRSDSLVHFEVLRLAGADEVIPKARVKALSDYALKVAKRALGDEWTMTDAATVSGWMATNSAVVGRHAEACAGADALSAHVAELHLVLKREAEAKEIKERAHEESIRKEIADWLERHGTAAQKRQFADGLVTEEGVKDLMRDRLFARLNAFPRYGRITRRQLAAAARADGREDLVGKEVRFTSARVDDTSESEQKLRDKIQQKMPEADVSVREHCAYYDGYTENDDPEVRRRSIRVTLGIGELVLAREYALD